MIHNLELHPTIIKKLTNLMRVQMALLRYAAKQLAIHQEECMRPANGSCPICQEKKDGKKNAAYICLACLERKSREYVEGEKEFSGRGKDIARWLYASKDRRDPLLAFARCDPGDHRDQERQKRLDWIAQMQVQVDALHSNNKGIIMHRLYNEKEKVGWKDAGAAFLIQFYNDLRSETRFPAALFSDAEGFGRQDFLRAFLERNHGLYICAICDEAGYYTSARGIIRTDIEHYFPKSIYPHLAVHPYNLIPICGHCNSIHGDGDPFDKAKSDSRHLGDIFLPYRGVHLSKTTYMDFELEKDVVVEKEGALEFAFAKVENIKLRPEYVNDHELKKLVAILKEMYDIPRRWQRQTEWANKVGETLFRRMRQYLRDATTMPPDHDMLPVAQQAIDHFLCNLYQEDMGKDPYAFAMTWLLAKLLNEFVEPGEDRQEQSLPGFLVEVDRWFKKNGELDTERVKIARELKATARERQKE